MSKLNTEIFSSRLKSARKKAGFSMQELSDRIDNLITRQSLSKYETGQMLPTTSTLITLARALDVKPDYFLNPPPFQFGNISFRKKKSLPAKDEEAIIEKAKHYVERFLELEILMGITQKFVNPLFDLEITGETLVEIAAYRLRTEWNLGNRPISCVTDLLEINNIKVLLVEESDDFDGFAVFTDTGIPVVIVNTRERSIERIRFTIIHELAHILLKFADAFVLDDKIIEEFCHYFASCFLIPKSNLLLLIGGPRRSHIDINELITIKEQYGISIAAITHRLRKLGVIDDTYYKRWVLYMRKTHGQREPGHFQGTEKPSLFNQLLNRALAEEIITISKAAVLSGKSIDELRNFNFE